LKLLFSLIVALTALASHAVLHGARAAGQPSSDVEPTVRYLIDYVAGSDLTFVRNEKRYSGAEAAQHMQRKYEHFTDDIHSVDDFIELAASRSLLSGKAYQVISASGDTVPTGEWLRRVLRTHCSDPAATRGAIQCPR
jgi:hypothetical protein